MKWYLTETIRAFKAYYNGKVDPSERDYINNAVRSGYLVIIVFFTTMLNLITFIANAF